MSNAMEGPEWEERTLSGGGLSTEHDQECLSEEMTFELTPEETDASRKK